MLVLGLLALTLNCTAPVLAMAGLTAGQQAVRVLTIPIPGGRGLLLITTPCGPSRAGSVGLWTARYEITGVHVIPLRSWVDRREFLGSGIINRLVLRVSTMQQC